MIRVDALLVALALAVLLSLAGIASATRGTRSFVLTPPCADKSCLVAAVQDFESFAPGPMGEKM